ncbi:MAG: aquaporin [Candidatus Ancillula sp.]|jgi:glycerol uptake facilitator-like aquaporin|nr:aquaporin [Candidatus Ancillula sp.]
MENMNNSGIRLDVIGGALSYIDQASIGTRYLFETISSFVFTLFSLLTASLTMAFFETQIAVLVVPLVTALVFYVAMNAFGKLSGGFVNPLLTLLYAFRKTIAPLDAFFLVIFEFIGAFLATTIVYIILPSNSSFPKSKWFELTAPGFGSSSPVSKFFNSSDLEFSTTVIIILHAVIFFLLIFSTTTIKKASEYNPQLELVPFTIFTGIALVPSVLLSGSSFNPARDIAAAVFGSFTDRNSNLVYADGIVLRSIYISLASLIVVGIVCTLEFPGRQSKQVVAKHQKKSSINQ